MTTSVKVSRNLKYHTSVTTSEVRSKDADQIEVRITSTSTKKPGQRRHLCQRSRQARKHVSFRAAGRKGGEVDSLG